MTSSTRPAFSWLLTVFIQSFRSLSCGAAAFTAASAYSRAWDRPRTKVTSCPGKASLQVLRIQGAPVGQYHQFLGCEQVVLKPDLPQASAEL